MSIAAGDRQSLMIELERHQKEAAERTLPWFLDNMPDTYFRLVPPELAKGLKTAVGEQGSIVIRGKDQFSNRCTRGGDRLRAVAGSAALIAKLKDRGDGTCVLLPQHT